MKLLKDLLMINSPSSKEDEMINFILEYVADKSYDVTTDAVGNIYIKKGTAEVYPCVVAHMDEVHKPNANKIIVEADGVIFGYDPVSGGTVGIGADDKNGIWVALKLLEKFDTLKVAFFIGEEVGCVGSKASDLEFFKDCGYVVQCDRKYGKDFISKISGDSLCSEEFIKTCDLEKYGYKPTSGLMTDVQALRNRGVKASCCNISCGYYNPHTSSENIHKDELYNCLNFVENIIKNCGNKRFDYEKPKPTYTTYPSYTPAPRYTRMVDNALMAKIFEYLCSTTTPKFGDLRKKVDPGNQFDGMELYGIFNAMSWVLRRVELTQ